jgi:hypothetical protein
MACSFAVGFCSALIIWALPVVSAFTAERQLEDDPRRPVFDGGSIGATQSVAAAVGIGGVIPQVRGFGPFVPIFKNEQFFNATAQQLDGLDCRDCNFRNVQFTYGGGVYRLVNAKFSGVTSISLVGAAANTLAFLQLLQGMSQGNATRAPSKNKPIVRQSVTKTKLKIDFSAPYIGEK